MTQLDLLSASNLSGGFFLIYNIRPVVQILLMTRLFDVQCPLVVSYRHYLGELNLLLLVENVASTHPLPSKRYSTFLIIYQELDNALTTKSLPLFLKLQRILLSNLLLMMLLMM